jgi:hypothetical protein
MNKPKKTKKKLSPKQASIKATNLLKGIDNSVAQMDKHHGLIVGNMKKLRSVLNGLSNAAINPPSSPAKPVKKTVTKKEAKKTTAVKPKATKATSKQKKEENPNRPPLKEVVLGIIKDSGPLTAAEIWNKATEKHGYWSRTSLYNLLKKNPKTFKKTGDKFCISNSEAEPKEGAEVDEFVKQVEQDQTVSATV